MSLSQKSRPKDMLAGSLGGRSIRDFLKSLCSTGLAVAVLFATAVSHLYGGTIRHDVADSLYTSLAAEADYEAVGFISSYASGVLVANNYVLTAGHIGDDNANWTFSLSSGDYSGVWEVINPDWTGAPVDGSDLALIRLDTLVLDEPPVEFYTHTDELGQIGVVVGFGETGTGDTGATEPRGTKRAGENTWDVYGSFLSLPNDILLADFDGSFPYGDNNWFGSHLPTGLEYLAAPGDSGAGMFLPDGGKQKLAGITSFIAQYDGENDSDYGDAMGVVRISSHLPWLTEQLSTAYTMNWVSGSGVFNAAENWQTTFDLQTVNSVPGGFDAITFYIAGSRTVTMPAADLSNTRMSVADGDVTFDLSGQTYALTDTSSSEPSLVIGEVALAEPTLTILDGTLSTQHAFLAPTTGAVVDMRLTGATWNAAGSVFVGGTDTAAGGSAILTVDADSLVNISGELNIWTGGILDLAGGTVSADQIIINGGTLTGWGTVYGDLMILSGVISPGEIQFHPIEGISVVPEPSSLAALLTAVAAFLAFWPGRGRR